MPGGFPLGQEVCNGLDYGSVTGTSKMTVVTPSATGSTKGSYAQLVAATTAYACAVYFCVSGAGATTPADAAYLIDIAIGTAGQEKLIISNILLPDPGSAQPSTSISGIVPINVPIGTRIAARCQCGASSGGAIIVAVMLLDGALTQMEGCAGADGLGVALGTSSGTVITAGSANTKGSYLPLIAATTQDYMGLYVVLGGNNVAASTGANDLVDIAIGAGGSEKVILPNLYTIAYAGYNAFPNILGPFFVPIPDGTRIAARCQSSTASQTLQVALLAFYQ